MTTVIVNLLITIGSLGIFLYGMKLMSESLQKLAGNKMRDILARMTSKPINGIFTGAFVTTIIQSSSATTVMVVSFVNAGLLSLAGAVAVIMGANIGTTATAWIISLLGLKFSMAELAIPIVAISIPFIFSKHSKRKSIGEFIVGFSLLFLGIEFMKDSIPDINNYPELLQFIAQYSNYGYFSILLFVLIGTILTLIVQSSSATMAITLLMCSQGWISFEVGAAMVLGENIGTTITANLAAMVANNSAKKAALSHLVFNVIGVVWMLILFFPFLNLVDFITMKLEGVSPFTDAVAIPIALSLFHSMFNITNTFVLVWFIPLIIKIVNFVIKNNPNDDIENFRLKYIDTGLVSTSELGIQSAKQEIEIFGQRVERMFTFLKELDDNTKVDDFEKTMERIKKYETITDKMEIEIAKYLTKITEGELSKQSSQKVTSMLRIIDNLESIGDSIYQMAILKSIQREQKIKFDTRMNTELDVMFGLVENSLKVMNKNLQMDYDTIDLEAAYNCENEINTYRNILRTNHLEAIKAGSYTYELGTLYSSIYALYEKTGDFVINVSEAMDNSQKIAEHGI
ncbi:MAG: Na/Pi cotransporter family protein [Bacteroidales bacterium]|nr:Na/Pi cotransporter family protein [Bacteroidales bacterium]